MANAVGEWFTLTAVVAVQCPASTMRPSRNSACLVVTLLAVLVSTGCHRVFCSDTAGQAMVSPDGRYVASVVRSDCGATEQATVVEVRRNRTLLQDRRSVFIMEGFQDVSVAWSGMHEMSIAAPSCDGQKTRLSNWNDVNVHCQVLTKSGANTSQ